MGESLVLFPSVAAAVIKLFYDLLVPAPPHGPRPHDVAADHDGGARATVLEALSRVPDLAHHEVLTELLLLVEATTRSNWALSVARWPSSSRAHRSLFASAEADLRDLRMDAVVPRPALAVRSGGPRGDPLERAAAGPKDRSTWASPCSSQKELAHRPYWGQGRLCASRPVRWTGQSPRRLRRFRR